ncbi:DUF2786 domain-containing protein [Microbacterium gilvum]|uniref:DUF2786 domain-containing protein n=1 Tax=Microbacterium gilvum TaxID=1336204 RepID=A0ABP9ANV8_9MICO
MSDHKLDLIAKLLAKAESTTPEEAEALTEHAERLMVKYGIDRARIDARRAREGRSQESVVMERMLSTGAYARELRDLGAIVADALGTLRPLQAEPAGAGAILYLVGFSSDVQQALVLIESLRVQALVAMRRWWSRERDAWRWASESERRRARRGFILGFGVGAAARIRENRRVVVEEAGTGTELVLASRRARVDAYVDTLATTKARSRRSADGRGFASGHLSGRAANTGEAALGARGSLPR